MKPLKLTMQAFGTFTEKTIIDFTPLHDKVFLIFGKTGSGKTTIFDAICYALYGAVTGDLRNKDTNENVRSTNADDKTPTYVEYEFEINHDKYVVKRTPGGQQIYKKITEYKSEKASIKKNGTLIEKKTARDVTNYISEDVIKLTRDQFKQTMMISQGDFAALIKASSDDRTKIFRNILGTYNIDLCSQKLKDKVKELSGKCELSKNSLVQSISFLPPELFDEEYNKKIKDPNCYTIYEEIVSLAKAKLDSLGEDNKRVLDNKALIEKQKQNFVEELAKVEANNKNARNYQEAVQNKEILENQKDEYDTLAMKLDMSNKSKEVSDKYDNYILHKDSFDGNQKGIQNCENALSLLEKSKPSIDENYEKIPSLEQEKENVSKLINTKEEALTKFKEVEDSKIMLDKAISNQKALNSDKETKEKKFKEIKEKHEAAQAYVNNNASILLEMDNCEKEIENNTKQNTKYGNLTLQYKQLLIDQDNILKKENSISLLRDKKNIAEGLYLTAKGKFMLNQAGYLAKNLKENEPCPVCGSIHHPQPCKEYEEEYTQDKVDELEKEFHIARDNVTKEESDIKSKQEILDNKKQSFLNDINESFNMSCSFDESRTTLEKIYKDIKSDFDGLVIKKSQLKLKKDSFLANKAIVENTSEFINAEKECENAINAFNLGNEKLTEAKTAYDTLLKTISGQDKASLNQELTDLKTKKKAIDSKITTYRNDKTGFDKQYSNNESALKTYKTNASLLQSNFEKALTKLEELENKYSIKRDNAKENILQEYVYCQIQEKLDKYKDEVTKNKGYLEQAIKNGYDKLVIASTDELNNSISELTQQIDILQQQIDKYNVLHETTTTILGNINDAATAYNEKSKDYIPYKELSDTFAGEIVGKPRMSFETFYQVQFFKQILALASRRFSSMTGGEYEILYKEETKGAAKVGLDMEVLDNYNGTRRNIGTLSGGESFMASLALALSMSDIIQAKAGGISIDSMFIDEGFGTLDTDVLNCAMTEISKLSVHGKTVGLISHIEQLKDRIPTQISVEKKEGGSTITFLI